VYRGSGRCSESRPRVGGLVEEKAKKDAHRMPGMKGDFRPRVASGVERWCLLSKLDLLFALLEVGPDESRDLFR
jgi:hypothetical protein